ncbi:MAG: ABC transporter permease [Gammaproteobacteria bacterium]|nr:ABC transporter permease [Gammaproteobacteria bacterium]
MRQIQLTKRPQASKLFAALSPLLAFALTLIAGAIIFWLNDKPPAQAIYMYFIEPLIAEWSLHDLAIKAAPLIMIGVGLAVCYRANAWNIGAEGQFVVGAIVGSLVPIFWPDFQSPLTLPLMLLLGALGGALFAAIPAWLKVRMNTNEILTSLMLVYVAQLLLDWLARGPLRDPNGFNFPQSITFSDAATLPEILPSSGATHYGFLLAIIVAIVAWFVLEKTRAGFQVRVVGASPRAGKFGGFSGSKLFIVAFMISGALAGMAGISEVSGAIGHMQPIISPGYGFTAIIVAFLGRLNPLGVVASGLVLALTYIGGEGVQMMMGVSDKVVRVFQGLLLFFVLACDTLIHYKVTISKGRG